jgi:nucleoid DNA-binding protein
MIYIIIERLYKGDSVNLKNLCDFKAKSRHARNVRNPQTKEIMTCKEVRVPKAVFSQSVKKIINGKV